MKVQLAMIYLGSFLTFTYVRKLPRYIMVSYAGNFFSKLLQGGKNIVAFCLTVKNFHRLFCIGSLDYECEQISKRNLCWVIPEKFQAGKRAKMVKDPQNFQICHFILVNFRQNEFPPLEILQNRVIFIRISGQKPKTKAHGNSAYFFLDHPSKFHFFFLLTPGISKFYFLITLELPCDQPSPV